MLSQSYFLHIYQRSYIIFTFGQWVIVIVSWLLHSSFTWANSNVILAHLIEGLLIVYPISLMYIHTLLIMHSAVLFIC